MKITSLIFIFSLITQIAFAEIQVDRLVESIGKAENSVKYPYGIKSINTHGDKALARKICRNSVVNNLKRWDGKGDFIEFMSRRYCPINAPDDNGTNRFWVKNVKYFYK